MAVLKWNNEWNSEWNMSGTTNGTTSGANSMTQTEVTKDEIMAVYPKVAETMADALGCDVADVKLDVSLIEGLDAESIDFLDMVFRLERAFKIKIPRANIVVISRAGFPDALFLKKAAVTEKGMAQLRSYLS